MSDHAESVVPLRTANTKANGFNVGEVGDPMYTLDTTGSHAVGYVVCFEGQRTDDFRVYPDVFPALLARMGTGGNNVPLIAHDIVSKDDEETR
jgi:hypothetical protein